MARKCTVVDPWNWLNEDGSFPEDARVRGRSIRVAQCIEYGGPLGIGEARQTLIACRFRPGGAACPGLMCVLKHADEAILAFCSVCHQDEFLIYEWEDTPWAAGPMKPVHVDDLARQAGLPRPTPRVPGPRNTPERLERALALLGSSMTEREVRARIGVAPHPMAVVDAVLESLVRPPTERSLERFLPVLMDAWNETPRPDLQGRSPGQARGRGAPDPGARPKVGRNAPCPCGSGRKHKRCCGRERVH